MSILRLLAAGFFLAFVVAQSPHLVHHLYERGQIHADCVFESGAERVQGLDVEVVTLIPAPRAETGGSVAEQPVLPSPALAPADARAPPLLAS